MWCDLYLIADTGLLDRVALAACVARALDGGVSAVQLRDKRGTGREMYATGEVLRHLTARAGARFFCNDRVDVALALGADGVHLGPDDVPLAAVRACVPPSLALGYSAGTPDEARAAESAGAAYCGVGAAYATTTKSDAGAPIGPAGIAAVRAACALPLVAIGGVTAARVPELVAAGADGVAVAGAILLAADPQAAARELREALESARRAR